MRLSLFSALVLAVGIGPLAQAQTPPPYQYDPVDIQRKAAHFMGGILGFAAVECKLFTSEHVAEVKRQQIQKSVADGLPAAEFEALYAQGYAEAKSQWAAQPVSEQTNACAQIRQLVGSAP